MNIDILTSEIDRTWTRSIVPKLIEYIRIPNKSPMFDPKWEAHGHMEAAIQLMADWCRTQPVRGMRVESPPAAWPPELRDLYLDDDLPVRLSDHDPVDAVVTL